MPDTKPYVHQVNIRVNGSDIPTNLMDVLYHMEIDNTLYVPNMFIIQFHDDELKWVRSSPFVMGASVEIKLSDHGAQSRDVGLTMKGEVTAVELQADEDTTAILTIRGYDKSHRLNRGTKTATFVNMTDSDIIKKLINEAGLSPNVEATSTVHEHVFQDNQTNLAFIHERAQRNGFEIRVDGDTIYCEKPTSTGEVELSWGTTLRSFNARVSAAGQVGTVNVRGWDPKTKKAVSGTASSTTIHPQTAIGTPSSTANKFGSAEVLESRVPVYKAAEATALAQAILNDINARFIQADGKAFGNTALQPGVKVSIKNMGNQFNGTYVVTSATHVYSHSGYDTLFTVEGARREFISDMVTINGHGSSALASTWVGVAIGIVTDNKDPEDMGRIKVMFPWMSEQEASHWARIVGFGAGAQRGLFVLPEVNDEVLVAFEQGDFNRPYIIGGLWNGTDKPPETAQDAVNGGKTERRTFKTRAGHIIRLTDKSGEEKIEIIDKTGKNHLTIDSTSNDMTIEVDGKVVIKAKGNVEVSADGNAEVKAKGSAKVESGTSMDIKAGASMNIQATGTLNIKGATVNIN